ncbi:unnamed protein product [Caenorhabditis nigoni]
MSKLESHASKKEEHSLISKELRKGFDDFSDELKADALSKTFVSDEIAKLEKLEDKLKKKKENFWLLVMLMMSIIFLSVGHYFRPKDQPTAGIWIRPAFKVAVVIFFFLLGFEVFEEIMDKITDWKRRRNMTTKVSLENADEKNERIFFIGTDYDYLMNRYQKLIKDVNENYEPMRNRYKRRFNRYVFYYVVGHLATLIIMICTAIEIFFYNTDPRKTYMVITQLLGIILLPVACYGVVQNQIAEENAI